MVPVDRVFSQTVHEIIQQLLQRVRRIDLPDSLSGLLAAHFLRSSQWRNIVVGHESVLLDEWLNEHISDLRDTPQLAVLGGLLYHSIQRERNVPDQVRTEFVTATERLRERKNVLTTANSWALHPDIVLGVALGVTATNDLILKNWLHDLLQEGLERLDLPYFSRLCYRYSVALLGHKFEPIATRQILVSSTINGLTLPELALSIWLIEHEVLFAQNNETSEWLEKAQSTLLERCLVEGIDGIWDEKAAIVLDVLSTYIHAHSQYPRLDLVFSILSNFEPALERWKSEWKIVDEYDIQSLLWLVLRSCFDDVRYEEYFPKLGRSGYRYDIGIPQLGLAIEAKFTRKQGDFQKIVDEIGKDAAQANAQTKFASIAVFVYDQTCAAEQHAWVKQAIESIHLVKFCVVQCAPYNMQKRPIDKPGKQRAKKPEGREKNTSSRPTKSQTKSVSKRSKPAQKQS